MPRARSLPTRTTILPLICRSRTLDSIEAHRTTTHLTELTDDERRKQRAKTRRERLARGPREPRRDARAPPKKYFQPETACHESAGRATEAPLKKQFSGPISYFTHGYHLPRGPRGCQEGHGSPPKKKIFRPDGTLPPIYAYGLLSGRHQEPLNCLKWGHFFLRAIKPCLLGILV